MPYIQYTKKGGSLENVQIGSYFLKIIKKNNVSRFLLFDVNISCGGHKLLVKI